MVSIFSPLDAQFKRYGGYNWLSKYRNVKNNHIFLACKIILISIQNILVSMKKENFNLEITIKLPYFRIKPKLLHKMLRILKCTL